MFEQAMDTIKMEKNNTDYLPKMESTYNEENLKSNSARSFGKNKGERMRNVRILMPADMRLSQDTPPTSLEIKGTKFKQSFSHREQQKEEMQITEPVKTPNPTPDPIDVVLNTAYPMLTDPKYDKTTKQAHSKSSSTDSIQSMPYCLKPEK